MTDKRRYSFRSCERPVVGTSFRNIQSFEISDGDNSVVYTPESGSLLFNTNGIPVEVRLSLDMIEELNNKLFNKLTIAGSTELIPKSAETAVDTINDTLHKSVAGNKVRSVSFQDRDNIFAITYLPRDDSNTYTMYYSHANGNRNGETNIGLDEKESKKIRYSIPNRIGGDFISFIAMTRKILARKTIDGRYPKNTKSAEIFNCFQNPEINRKMSNHNRISFGQDPLVSIENKNGRFFLRVDNKLDVFAKPDNNVTIFFGVGDNKYMAHAMKLHQEDLDKPEANRNSPEVVKDIKDSFRIGAEKTLKETEAIGLTINRKNYILSIKNNEIVFDNNSRMKIDEPETMRLRNLMVTDSAKAYEKLLDHEISNTLDKNIEWKKHDYINLNTRNQRSGNPGITSWTGGNQVVIRTGNKLYIGKMVDERSMVFDVADTVSVRNGEFSDIGNGKFRIREPFSSVADRAEMSPESLIKTLELLSQRTKDFTRKSVL